MPHWKLPVIKRCCFCVPLRYGLIVWGYITLMVNFIILCDKIATVHNLINKDDHDYSVLYKSCELMVMLADILLVIVLVVAAHMKNLTLLKISFIGNLTSVIVYTLYNIYMVSYYSQLLSFLYQLSSDSAGIKRIIWMLVGVAAATCIEILMKFYIMFILRKEIKKLETNRGQFSFVNNAAEAKCKMESDEMENGMFKPIEIEDEEKREEDTFDKQTTVGTGEGIEVTCEKEKCEYSFNNMTETKCKLENDSSFVIPP